MPEYTEYCTNCNCKDFDLCSDNNCGAEETVFVWCEDGNFITLNQKGEPKA